MADVTMPRLGVSVTEGTLSVWLKQVGDAVDVGDALCEISTDKVDTEVESTAAGVLTEQLFVEGDTVPVGAPLARIGSGDGDVSAPVPPGEPVAAEPSGEAAQAARLAVNPAEPGPVAARPPANPARLRAGRFDHRAVLAEMIERGSRRGRRRGAAPAEGVDASAPATTPLAGTSDGQVLAGIPPGYQDVAHEIVENSRIRRVIAEHMSRSRRTAAHMTTEVDVDLGLLTEVRQQLNRQRAAQAKSKLSYLPFIARATCAALLDHRELNSTFQDEHLIRWGQVNLGIAVDTPRGLMVPVVRDAERLTVEPLAKAITTAAGKVRDGTAGPDDFRAGTFTISNPGSVGAVSAPAIINQPQVGILGMPAIVRKPWVVRLNDAGESIAIRPIIRLALTFDHRAVDGGDATRCLVNVRNRLEAWGVDDYR